MDSLRINLGVKRLLINDGPDVLEFNPSDVLFADRFYKVVREVDVKQAEYTRRDEELENKKETDGFGLPANLGDRIALMNELCEYMREQIDYLFGTGTSQKLFGDTLNVDAIGEFFEAITPYFASARNAKVEKYTKGKHRHTVMK